MYKSLTKLLPFLDWLGRYRPRDLCVDIIAGVSVGLVLIPQSMANAQLAGLPAHYGLYAALFPTIISALFSSSKYMCTGMVAIVAMMTAAALQPLAVAGSENYIAYCVLLSFMVGIIQIMLRVLRLSFLVSFLSQPVIAGFTNAALILIALSQLSKLFGVTAESAGSQVGTFINVVLAAYNDTHWPTLLLALLASAIIQFTPKLFPRAPVILIAVTITGCISWATGYERIYEAEPDQVRSETAHKILGALGIALRLESSLQAQRDAVTAELHGSNQHDQESQLELQYQVEQIDIAMRRLRAEMKIDRSQLRSLRFYMQEEDGKFFLTDPENLKPEERTGPRWRVLINDDLHNTEKIVFFGGGTVVGNIPQGIPPIVLPHANADDIFTLLPFAFAIAFIALANTISVAKATARATGDRISNKQELLAQGLANIASGLSQSAPVAGSFSSSAINCRSGAKSPMSAVFAGLTTLIALAFLTRLMYYIPLSVLAAVVILSMIHQIKFSVFKQEWQVQWSDGLIGVVTFCSTLLLAPHLDLGLMIGVTLSMVIFIYRSMHPGITTLAYSKEHLRVQDIRDVKDVVRCDYINVLRFQQALVFINSNMLEEYVVALMERKPKLKHIHLVCTGINDIDSSGEDSLTMLVRWARKAGISMSLNGLNERVTAVLERAGLLDEIGRENIFHTMQEGICVAHGRIPETQSPDHKCSWQEFCE